MNTGKFLILSAIVLALSGANAWTSSSSNVKVGFKRGGEELYVKSGGNASGATTLHIVGVITH